MSYIRAPLALITRAQSGVTAGIGRIASETNFQTAERATFVRTKKTAHLNQDLHVQELESQVLPAYELHQGPLGTYYKGAERSYSGYRPHRERKQFSNGRKSHICAH